METVDERALLSDSSALGGPCPLCGATGGTLEDSVPYEEIWDGLEERHHLTFSDHVRAAHTPTANANLYRCSDCRLSFFWPVVPGDAEFWGELDEHGGYQNERWDFGWAADRIRPGDAVCDIGCGPGAFLASLEGIASRRVGIDQNPELMRRVAETGIETSALDLAEYADLHCGEFDVVCAFQVIEHLTDIGGFLEAACRLLRPDGRLLLSVPNRNRFTLEPFQPLDCPPHHVSRWTVDQLHELGRRHGLVVSVAATERLKITTPVHVAARRAARAVISRQGHRDAQRRGTGARAKLVGHAIAAEYRLADARSSLGTMATTGNTTGTAAGDRAGDPTAGATSEILAGQRFAFGSNWRRFLELLDESRISRAEVSMRQNLPDGQDDLTDRTFIDAGSGSGLFSLAAHRLGATVTSFDFDTESVSCTEEVRARYAPGSERWTVTSGSVLDRSFLDSLGTFDVVYSWGVLHHTGDMWTALQNVTKLVAPGGRLVVSLYNDQGWRSSVWKLVKRAYCRLPRALRWTVLAPSAVALWARPAIRDLVDRTPRRSWDGYGSERGMDPVRDLVDWVGGHPFEVASPSDVHAAMSIAGFMLVDERLVGRRNGCNEFVFVRS